MANAFAFGKIDGCWLEVKDKKLKHPGNIDRSSPTRVAEIICLEELNWDLPSISMWLEDIEIAKLKVPLHEADEQDKLVWPFTAVGQYLMKSGYKELKKHYGNESSLQPSSSHLIDRSTWKAIWSLQVPNKVKIFL
ncbi:hypothetical protein J1N35_023798 [Gossypium stocksii]|uniref:Uncharacterized protein n=1 Tax=Gossypium stocksii TaxID=47602 RepID=A0A9D4A417_9ROSI|nr:hypothetical protein J1N35_023798 [Gossypium stocksii]